MKKLLIILLLLFPVHGAWAKEFKSNYGFTYELDESYLVISNFPIDKAMIHFEDFLNEESVKNPDLRKVLEAMKKMMESGLIDQFELLFNPSKFSWKNSINIIHGKLESKGTYSEKFFDFIRDDKYMKLKCEQLEKFWSEKHDIDIHDCNLINVPKSADWSQFIEKDILDKKGRVITIEFAVNKTFIIITGTCDLKYCNTMREELLNLATSIKF